MGKFIGRHLPFVAVFLLVTVVVIGGYFYKNNISYNNPEAVNRTEIQMLTEEVGQLIVLPTNETPTIATVSDPSALKNQAFFADAKKGDKVLIYTNAKKAILYDPIIKKIVNMAPVNTGDFPNKPEELSNTKINSTTSGSNKNEF
ncbi:MAG: hypothetical protein KBC06_01490 [Candidatus Pacebacteria bacterium]|nr:hypothetical protein [Candidatus Paceibacterota bacterium]